MIVNLELKLLTTERLHNQRFSFSFVTILSTDTCQSPLRAIENDRFLLKREKNQLLIVIIQMLLNR
jgi:hypothetical protein